MNDRLKACPFCGGKAKILIKCCDNKTNKYKVKCSNCGVKQNDYTSNKVEAIWNWNRRPIIESIIVKIKEYQEETSPTVKKHITGILNLIDIEDKNEGCNND